jgi:hypothetical protein
MAKKGRPLNYKSNEEMQIKIDEYFEQCKGEYLTDSDGKHVFNKYGEPIIINDKPPTITGLALSLGFKSRQALLNYQGKKEFNDTITRAKSICEEYSESRLYDRDGEKGAEFSLKCNFGWRDKDKDDENIPQVIIIDDIRKEK